MKKILAILILLSLSNVSQADTVEEPSIYHSERQVWMTCNPIDGRAVVITYFYSSTVLTMTDSEGIKTNLRLDQRKRYSYVYDTPNGEYTLVAKTGGSKIYSSNSGTNADCR